jgi:hypothetical protein
MPPGSHYSRIESHETCPGFPDVHVTFKGVTTHLELKANLIPSNNHPFKEKGLRRAQIIWINEELEVAGRVLIVAQVQNTIFFVHGSHASAFNNMTVADLQKISLLNWDRYGHCDSAALHRLFR